MTQKKLDSKAVPFRGGCKTYLEPALLKPGEYSMVQNFRQMHPGLKKRPGMIKLHTTADGTNRTMSLFQFSKGKLVERHFYAQMSDGYVMEATNAPPTVTDAAFGSDVHTGTASGMIPASWSNYDDTMIYSNGSDQHQLYYGQTARLGKFIVYKGGAAIPDFPILGQDYTDEVNDGLTTTVAVLDDLGDLAVDFDCVFMCFPCPIHTLNWTVSAANANCAVPQIKYRKNDNTWATVASFADGTDSPAYAATFTDDMSATTNWTAVNADLTSVAGGQSGNMLTVAENGGANVGKAYKDITTVVSQNYFLKCYFKKGTSANGKIMIGTTGDEDSLWDSGNLTDADWALKEKAFTASATTTRITLQTNDATAAETSLFDTISVVTGVTLAQSGAMTWTKPTDSIPTYMFGAYGYWYQFSLSHGDLDAEVEVSGLTFESSWNSLVNLWDGVLVDGAEAQVYDNSAGTYAVYGTTSIDLNDFAVADYLYLAFSDPMEAIYFDVLDTPSTTGSNTIDGLDYWNGTAWATVGTFTDNTIGLTSSGFIVLPKRTSGLEQRLCFNSTQYYAYWYRISVNAALSPAINIGVLGIPTYDISDFGTKGACNAIWKNRMVYTFTQWPNYIYISAEGNPQCLNGSDYDIKDAGDGRSNKIVCMKQFYNELMVWQEEKGVEGGMLTLFDGYDPSTFGRLTLSSKHGTMNSQSAVVVEGFAFGGTKDAASVAFFLSRSGILYTEGKTVSHVPGFEDIRNYFDPTNTNCIHQGYESHMWLKYDSAFNILRIGLVTGSATVCNTFLTYDLTDLTFGVDVYTPALSAFTECEAASGTAPVLQVGGGTANGFIYLLNSGLDDVSTAIDAYVTLEFDDGGEIIHFDELMLRMKAQSTGSITITPSLNSIAQTSFTLAQTAETATQTIRRHKNNADITGQHISLKIQHNTATESCYLEDMRPKIRELAER